MIRDLATHGPVELAQVSMLGFFRHLFKDILQLLGNKPELASELLPSVCGMLALLLLEATAHYPALRQILAADLDRFMRLSLPGPSSGAIDFFRRIIESNPRGVAEEILRAAGIVETPNLGPLYVVLPWVCWELAAISSALETLNSADWAPIVAERDSAQ